MNRPQMAVILCGGLGTRMLPHTDTQPKPMIPCNGKHFMSYILEQLAELGIRHFVLLIGYLGEQIEEYFKDGSQWGWEIEYSQGPAEWETGLRIWEARELLDESFLLLYSDNFVPFPYEKALTLHQQNGSSLTFMISPKSPGNIAIDEHGIVQLYDNNRDEQLKFVEIGYMIVERDRMLAFFEIANCSFSSILLEMASQGQISALVQGDAYHSISDPERWKKTEKYLQPKKILLIDRDGVINRKAPRGEYVSTWEQFEWIQETREAMKQLAREGFEFIIISNQAGIARGIIDSKELDRIHSNLKVELSRDGVKILDFYVCPHHWDEGCFCRKPNPGMLYQASSDYLLRLDKTIFIGDDPRDCQTAWNAGCISIFIGDSRDLTELADNQRPAFDSSGLKGALNFIREQFSFCK